MAVLTDHYEAMVVYNPTAAANDRVSARFVFRNDTGPGGDVHTAIVDRLQAFYDTPSDTQPAVKLWGLFAQSLVGTGADAVEVRIYDLGDTPPRTPTIRHLTRTQSMAGGSDIELPYDVCVVASLVASAMPPTLASTTNPKVRSRRRTGRLYLGPLGSVVAADQALTGSAYVAGAGRLAPHATARAHINKACEGLASFSAGDGVRWRLYSAKLNRAEDITSGWTDGEFDTQRRRGLESPARTVWPAA